MKITKIAATPVAIPLISEVNNTLMRTGPSYLIEAVLEVFTDEGITGIAEIPVVAGATMAVDLVMSAEDKVLGKDPTNANIILKELYSCYNLNHLHMHVANWAVNSIERACWDIVGQKVGLPLYELWGGAFRKEINFFGVVEPSNDLEAMKRDTKQRVEQGYKVIYTKVGFGTPDEDIEMVKAMREAIPNASVKIRVDANQAWTVGEAINIINRISEYGIDCVDQPVIMYNLDALKTVKEATRVPIAAHESTWTMFDMLRVIKENAADAVHIDPRFDAGYYGAKISAGIAEAAGVPIICHAYYELGIALMERMQFIAAHPAFTMANQLGEYEYLKDDIIKGGKLKIKNGCIELNDKPGLGVELDKDKVEKYYETYIKEIKEGGFENATESPLYGAQFTRAYLRNLYK